MYPCFAVFFGTISILLKLDGSVCNVWCSHIGSFNGTYCLLYRLYTCMEPVTPSCQWNVQLWYSCHLAGKVWHFGSV